VSRLWPERLSVGLAPDAVEYALTSRRGRRVVVSKEGVVPVADHRAERWRGALLTLAEIVKANAIKNANCAVLLSGHFVRCEVLAWSDNLKSAKEYEALAHAKFRAVHGAAADAWDIRLGALAFRQPVLAFAVDKVLIREIDALLSGAGLVLSSVQPHFCAVFDHHRGKIKSGVAWFGLLEPGRLWLGCLVNGIWRHASCRVIGNDPSREMLSVFAQERALFPEDVGAGMGNVHAVVTGFSREVVHALRAAGVSILSSTFPQRFEFRVGNREVA